MINGSRDQGYLLKLADTHLHDSSQRIILIIVHTLVSFALRTIIVI